MTESNGSGGSGAGEEPDDGWTPSIDQPWRPVHPDQIMYLFDYGQPWCQDRYGHPQYQPSGYPSITHHPSECQSYGGWFDGWFEDARAGLNGPPGLLLAYLVRPYRFGQRRWRQEDETRLAIEFAPRSEGAGRAVSVLYPGRVHPQPSPAPEPDRRGGGRAGGNLARSGTG